MKLVKLILIGISLVTLSCMTLVAAEAPILTSGYANGRWWITASEQQKIGYVTGLCDGVAWNTPENGTHELNSGSSYVSYAEMAKGIDKFYEQPENANLPIIIAAKVFTGKVKGQPEKELADYILIARRLFAAPAVRPEVK